MYGTDNLATTGELASLALLYSRQRQFQTAEAMHKRVVTLWQNRIDQIKRSPAIDRRAWFFVWTLAPESYDAKYNYSVDPSGYIDSSNALASIYTQQGRYTEAEAQYVESLKTLVWLSGEIEDGSNGILSTKYTGKPSSQYFLMNLSKQYYTALAETLESYAALLRKMGVSREAEASAMELRAKEVRDKEAKAYRNENYP